MAANDILFSGLADLTQASALSARYLMMIADRRALPNHPALSAGYQGSINDARSNIIKVSHVGLLGYDDNAQTADGSSVGVTGLTDSSSTITVVRYSKSYAASDLARMTAGGILNVEAFAADAVQTQANRMTDVICDLIDGFTATGGTTGVDLDVADIVAALATMEVANMSGPFMGVLHGAQWGDLQGDIAVSLGGALAFQSATADLVGYRGEAFKGSWLGVDWFVSNRVNSNGTDRQGAIFGPGAILWADGMVPVDDPSQQMSIGGKILFERDRTASAGTTAWVQHAYFGASIGLQNGLTLGSDA